MANVDKLVLEKYPYFASIVKYSLIVEPEDIALYREDSRKVFNGISVTLLKDILENKDFFSMVDKVFNGELEKFNVSCVVHGDTGASVSVSRVEIVKGIEEAIYKGILSLTPEMEMRYKELKAKVNFDSFKEKMKDEKYTIEMDGVSYIIPVENFFRILELTEEEYESFGDRDIEELMGVQKEYFICAAHNFFKEHAVLDNYVVEERLNKIISDLGTSRVVDIEAIQLKNPYASLYANDPDDKVHRDINPELRSAIFEGMPAGYSKLEQAIFIYIKMCKLLTYDEEFYAMDQKGSSALKHEDVSRLDKVTPQNNNVVCYEFNAIFGILLEELGLDYKVDRNLIGGYGGAHASLSFRVGKYLIKADSVTSILNGDLFNAKINQHLKGLECVNKNKNSREEFAKILLNVYREIVKFEKEKEESKIDVSSLSSLIAQYRNKTEVKDVPLKDRLDILIGKVNESKLVGIDAMSYVIQLKRILFTEEQLKNNISFHIVKKNEFESAEIAASPIIIIAINVDAFESEETETIYYTFYPHQGLIKVTKNELSKLFRSQEFEYISKDDKHVPGIGMGGMQK